MQSRIAVLGAGNMGTAVAQILAENGHRVRLWDYNVETVLAMQRTGRNGQFLPGVKLSKRIAPQEQMRDAVRGCALAVIAVTSAYVRKVAGELARCLGERSRVVVAHVAKGLEPKTLCTMHEVIQSEFPRAHRPPVVTLSGPSIAKEFVRGVPTAVVAASEDKQSAQFVQNAFALRTFKVALSRDVRGVGLCGALKNVYAIALGMCDGMEYAMDAKAFLFSIALNEMSEAVQKLGGRRETAYGLAGAGDLVVTGFGAGRNRAVGERICREGHCRFIFDGTTETTEGVGATKAFVEFARRRKLAIPIAEMVHRVLYRGIDPCRAVETLFSNSQLVSG